MKIFVTGASGWIGSAVVPELLAAGHQVVGLARSDRSAAALVAVGAESRSGTIDDLDVLKDAAAESDGVIHLAFRHDIAFSGDFQGAGDSDRRAVETFGDLGHRGLFEPTLAVQLQGGLREPAARVRLPASHALDPR